MNIDLKILESVSDADFSDPKQLHRIPLLCPKGLAPADRFVLDLDYAFPYMGRHHFKVIEEQYGKLSDRGTTVMRVIGNQGGGKSHILAVWVVSRYIERMLLKKDARRVVYVPECEDLVRRKNPVAMLCEFISYAFSDDPDMVDKLQTIQTTGNFSQLSLLMSKLPRFSIDFVFDQWGALMPEKENDLFDKRYKIQEMCQELTTFQFRIEAVSSGNRKIREKMPHGFFVELFGGLDDEEWSSWITKPELFPLKLAPSEHERDIVADLTGRIPLLLSEFYTCCQHTNTLDDAVKAYDEVTRNRIASSMDKFAKLAVATESSATDYMQMMTNALLETKSLIVFDELLDDRYFYRQGLVIHPISGLVRRIMSSVLMSVQRDAYMKAVLTPSWVSTGLASANRVVQGFAFEHHCLSRVLTHPQLYLQDVSKSITNVEYKRFVDPPSKSTTDSATSPTMYVPDRYNYPRVDAVLVCTLANIRRKRTSAGDVDVKRAIVGIQVTLEDPRDHSDSLLFFSDTDSSGTHYTEWLSRGDATDVQRFMLWICPSHNKSKRSEFQLPETPRGCTCTQILKLESV